MKDPFAGQLMIFLEFEEKTYDSYQNHKKQSFAGQILKIAENCEMRIQESNFQKSYQMLGKFVLGALNVGFLYFFCNEEIYVNLLFKCYCEVKFSQGKTLLYHIHITNIYYLHNKTFFKESYLKLLRVESKIQSNSEFIEF